MSSTKLSGYDLSSKAMLVSLTIRAWGGSKLDKSETDRVSRDNGTSKDAVKVTKDLVGDKLDDLRRSERAIRAVHRNYTLPWADDSTRLLPTAVWQEYQSEMTALVEKHREEVIPEFVRRYRDEVIPSARQRLGALFREDDFPVEIEDKFSVVTRFLPVPEAGDVRVGLSKDEVAALQQEVQEATREAYEAAAKELVDRATKPLERLAEALTQYEPGRSRLSKSLLENVGEIAALMPALDVSGNPVITDLAEQIGSLVSGLSTDRLAINGRARARVAAEAKSLTDKLASIL